MYKVIRIFIGAASALSVHASNANLLTNGSFETGDLTGWSSSGGTGVVVKSSKSMNPSIPSDGTFFFSASNSDGAVRGTNQRISISQLLVISDSMHALDVGGNFSGAAGVGNPSNDLVQISLSFFSSGELLGAFSTSKIDPLVGSWNLLELKNIAIPSGTTHALFEVSTFLDPGFASIDIGADGLYASAVPEPSGIFLLSAGALVVAVQRRRKGALKNL